MWAGLIRIKTELIQGEGKLLTKSILSVLVAHFKTSFLSNHEQLKCFGLKKDKHNQFYISFDFYKKIILLCLINEKFPSKVQNHLNPNIG